MANAEHVEILNRGVKDWNRWREEHPELRPDLSGADLRKLHIGDANLSGADLREADLSGLYLCQTNLVGADLREAYVVKTEFFEADLSRAILYNIFLFETVFLSTTLKNAKGLDTCVHQGPSTLDHRTLQKSSKLPLKFLRGCGLPDLIIDNVAVVQGDPLQFYSCFISHASSDKGFVDRLYADLQNRGIRCWYSSEDLKTGDRFRDVINQAIRAHDKLLVVLSENSVYSDWVETEVERAFSEERRRKQDAQDRPTVLFPIRLDDEIMKTARTWADDIRLTRHIGDFSNWKDHDSYQKAFERLLKDLQAAKRTNNET